MHRPVLLLFTALLTLCAPALGAEPLAAWVQLGKTAEVRVLVSDTSCPAVLIDGESRAMDARAPSSVDFPQICSAPIPVDTKSLTLNGRPLPLPPPNPFRILI